MPLADSALHSAQQALRTEATLRDISRALEAAALPFLALKGVHLAAAYYPRIEDRPHQDVDILVREPHFQRACESLAAAGFLRRAPGPGRAATEREFYNHGYVSRAGVPVDVHRDWAGYRRYRLDADGLFARACSFRYGRAELSGLCPEDLLLYLSVHMAKGYFASIERKHVQDIAVLLSRASVDWPAFVARARAARCRVGAYYALRAASEQYAAIVPREVMDGLRPRTWRRLWIERTLDTSRFPLCRIPCARMGRIQARLAWPLLDRPDDWLKVTARFVRLRAEDWIRARGAARA